MFCAATQTLTLVRFPDGSEFLTAPPFLAPPGSSDCPAGTTKMAEPHSCGAAPMIFGQDAKAISLESNPDRPQGCYFEAFRAPGASGGVVRFNYVAKGAHPGPAQQLVCTTHEANQLLAAATKPSSAFRTLAAHHEALLFVRSFVRSFARSSSSSGAVHARTDNQTTIPTMVRQVM